MLKQTAGLNGFHLSEKDSLNGYIDSPLSIRGECQTINTLWLPEQRVRFMPAADDHMGEALFLLHSTGMLTLELKLNLLKKGHGSLTFCHVNLIFLDTYVTSKNIMEHATIKGKKRRHKALSFPVIQEVQAPPGASGKMEFRGLVGSQR